MTGNSNIVVDIGNTLIKSAQVTDGEVSNLIVHKSVDLLGAYLKDYPKVIVSTVGQELAALRKKLPPQVYFLTRQSKLPITLDYETPGTLGTDRIAGAVGASFLFPGESVLVVDMGSCITYDLVTATGSFIGGAISPGVSMRLRAMHDYTEGLPLLELSPDNQINSTIGRSTAECMLIGVKSGVIAEINDFIRAMDGQVAIDRVVLTGGGAHAFESKIKGPIFAHPNLVMVGLNQILIRNEFS